MAKDSIRDFSATAGSNTDIQSVNIDENCPASGINNAIRELMVDLKNVSTGAVNLETPAADSLTVAGNLTVDTNTLKVDSSNNRVGIGTDAPVHNVEIVATAAGSVNDSLQIRNNATSSGTGSRIRFINSTDANSDANGASIASVRNGNDNDLVFETENSTRMTIDHAGKVGIGTDNPINTFQVNGDAVRFYNSADTDALHLFGFNNSNHADYSLYTASGNNNVKISTSETSFFNGGDVLIGATSRSNVERVNISYARATHCGMVIDCTDSTAITAAIKFFNTNGDVGSIDMSGSSTSYTTSSDHRLKQGVEDMTGAIDRVKALAPKRFQFIADADTTVDGFLAHEAQAVVPEAVTGTKDEVDEDGNAVMQGIDQGKLVPLLTGALKEAITKIETLETEMTALKARVTALEA